MLHPARPGNPVRISHAALLLLVLALFAACSGPASDDSGQNHAMTGEVRDRGEPVDGGRVVEALLADASNLLPPLASDSASHEVAEFLYVSLVKSDKDLNIVPYAAESFEVLDGGRLFRFTLRDDIRWFDGEPLTAEDVRFTYELMIDPETPTAYGGDYEMVAEFTVTGPHSLEIRYDEPFAPALSSWAMSILPEHVLAGEDLRTTRYIREPLGCGPYKLEEWVSGDHVVLTANEDYFEGRPHVDEVVYRIIPDQATQFLELKAGSLDMMGLAPLDAVYMTDGPFWRENFRKFEYLSSSYTYLGYNLKKPLFQDLRVRQALDFAIDEEEIVRGVLLGKGVAATGPFKPGTWAYGQGVTPRPYDPDKALELLAEAGWEDHDGDGVLDRDGKDFVFTILTNQGNAQRIKTATIIQYRLARIGIKVAIRTVEWAAFLREFVDKGRYDALILAWTLPLEPDPFDVWHSSKAFEGGLNFIYYQNPELDALLEAGRATLDQDERQRIYEEVQEILHRDQPYCFLYVPLALPIVQSRIQGIEPAPAGISYNFIHWWIPRELQRTGPAVQP